MKVRGEDKYYDVLYDTLYQKILGTILNHMQEPICKFQAWSIDNVKSNTDWDKATEMFKECHAALDQLKHNILNDILHYHMHGCLCNKCGTESYLKSLEAPIK